MHFLEPLLVWGEYPRLECCPPAGPYSLLRWPQRSLLAGVTARQLPPAARLRLQARKRRRIECVWPASRQLLPWLLEMALIVSCSCQNWSLSWYWEKEGWDWFLRDPRSASTHAIRELVGSWGVIPRSNLPVRRPLEREQVRTCHLQWLSISFGPHTLSVGSKVAWPRPLSCTPPEAPIPWIGRANCTVPGYETCTHESCD